MRWFVPYALALVVLSVAFAAFGCRTEPESAAVGAADTPGFTPEARQGVQPGAIRVVFLGDSLTAGLGLAEAQAFPALLERRLIDGGWPVRVINAGVSGDTSAGGLSRLDWLLRQEPAVLVVALGANDGLRGLSWEMTERNLREIIERSRAAGVQVVLAGMRLPPNYGADYVEPFEALFPRLARELDAGWVPFLLEGVGGRRSLNLADGIHPNARGHQKMAEHLLPAVIAALEKV